MGKAGETRARQNIYRVKQKQGKNSQSHALFVIGGGFSLVSSKREIYVKGGENE